MTLRRPDGRPRFLLRGDVAIAVQGSASSAAPGRWVVTTAFQVLGLLSYSFEPSWEGSGDDLDHKPGKKR